MLSSKLQAMEIVSYLGEVHQKRASASISGDVACPPPHPSLLVFGPRCRPLAIRKGVKSPWHTALAGLVYCRPQVSFVPVVYVMGLNGRITGNALYV